MKSAIWLVSVTLWLSSSRLCFASAINNTFSTADSFETTLSTLAGSTIITTAVDQPESQSTKSNSGLETQSFENEYPADLRLQDSSLSYQFEVAQDPAYLSFWYNLATYEEAAGFDEPAFEVWVDEQLVYQVWASDLIDEGLTDGSYLTADETGWRQVIVPFPDSSRLERQVTFSASDTGDGEYPSVVYLRDAAVADQLHDSLNPTPVTDLQVYPEANQSYTLTWSAPSDSELSGTNRVCSYQVRSSYQPISEQLVEADWLLLSQLQINDQPNYQPMSLLAPRPPGEIELFQVKPNSSDLSQPIKYLAVASYDCAGNFSGLAAGSISQVGPVLEVVWLDEHHVQVIGSNLGQEQEVEFSLTYQHLVDDQLMTEVVLSQLKYSPQELTHLSPAIPLGSCSQDDCAHHQIKGEITAKLINL